MFRFNFWEGYKTAPIAALQQAKFYLPRQSAAAAAGSTAAAAVNVPQYTSDYIPARVLQLVYCGSHIYGCFCRSGRAAGHKG